MGYAGTIKSFCRVLRLPAGNIISVAKLGIKRNGVKAEILGKVKHDVHVLYSLTGGSLYQVVYRADNYRSFFPGIRPYAYVAEIRTPDAGGVRECSLGKNPYERRVLIELPESVQKFAGCMTA